MIRLVGTGKFNNLAVVVLANGDSPEDLQEGESNWNANSKVL
jgi:hypothetical protein